MVTEKVTRIVRDGAGEPTDGFVLFAGDEIHRARSVVLATGVLLEGSIEGEEDLLGQGVSYCVTCDGRLFAGRRVVFISYGPPGEDAARDPADEIGVEVLYLPQYQPAYRLAAGVRGLEGSRPEPPAREDGGVTVTFRGGCAGEPLLADAGEFLYEEAARLGIETAGRAREDIAREIFSRLETKRRYHILLETADVHEPHDQRKRRFFDGREGIEALR